MIFLLFFLSFAVPIWLVVRWFIELIPEGGINSKAVFITGCDSGFGRELAVRCVKNGFLVFAGCFTDEGATSLEKEVHGFGELKTLKLDVTKEKDVKSAVSFVEKNLGDRKLWAIVNNAGIFTVYGPDDWTNIDDYKQAMEVNTFGVIRVVQAFKHLLKSSKGRIITVSSINGRLATPYSGPYVASKFAIEGYLDSLRQEYKPFGVRVNILEPGIFLTPLFNEKSMIERVDKVWSRLDKPIKEEYGEKFKNFFGTFFIRKYKKLGTDRTYYVVDNYYHAITAKFPRNRYYCGWDALLVFVPLSLLPSWFSDWVLGLEVYEQTEYPACLSKKKLV